MTRTRLALRLLLLSVLLSVFHGSGAGAAETHPSPYVGQDTRPIKSLSADDILELRRGGGWGLAKAAELNGMPGPAHLLELKDEIPLSPEQVAAISAIFEEMRARAIAEGERLIAGEQDLEKAFDAQTVTDQSLLTMLSEIGEARTALRYTHLTAHLKTLPTLTDEQIASYNALRGYAGDPCDRPPQGHDLELWRRHNGCD